MRFEAAAAIAVALSLLIAGGPVRAEGVFVPVPSRIDHVYDAARDVLYISSGGRLVRYELATGTFLAPLEIGTTLYGMDLSPDGEKLVVADATFAGVRIVDLETLDVENVEFTRASGEGGTFTAAYGADGSILTTSTFNGSGWVPLRRHVPSTGVTTELTTITQNTMLAPSADRSVIGFAESNISDGRFGRYRVSDGDIIRKQWYEDGTGWFNYEMGASRDGQQYAIPTYGGTYLTDAAMGKHAQVIGVYASGHPIGAAYHPSQDLVYFPWATTSQVRVYDTQTLAQVDTYEFESAFDHPGNHAFQEGRAKVSRDGKLLFVTVDGGVRYVSLAARAPATLTATAGDGAVTLEWSARAGATGYRIYQSTTPNSAPGMPVATGVPGTSLTLESLDNGTTYYFRVATESAAGVSTPSGEASATPVAAPTAPVTGLQATAGNARVDLSWTALAGASSYIVYRGTSSGDATPVATGVTGTTYAAQSLVNGTTYYFQVAGMNSSGTGPRSSEVAATPFPPPAAPTLQAAVPGDRAVTVSWSAAEGATSYNLYVATSADYPSATPSRSNIAGTSFTFSGLANGVTYYFKVAAVNAAGVGAKSNELSATPTPMTHVALWLSHSTVAAGQSATLNWVASNATACTATGAWNGSPSFSGSQTLALAAGSYTFTLGCEGANGTDEESATLTVTPAAPIVAIGLDDTAIDAGEGATLTWSSTSAESCTASDAWSGDRATAGSLVVQPAVAGSYTYTLTCGNDDGETTQSVTLSVSDPAGPTLTMSLAPATVTLGSAAILSWDSTGATECMADDAWSGAKPVTSSVAVQPTAVGGYTYSLTCTGPGGTTARSVALIVNSAPVPVDPDDGGGGGGGGGLGFGTLLGLALLGSRRRRAV